MVPTYPCRCAGAWLDQALNSGELDALIAADPHRVGRLLRPIFRMFGTPVPEALKPPRRKRRPRQRAPRPEPIALPKEVAAFVRHERQRQRQRRAAKRAQPESETPSLRAEGEAIQGQRAAVGSVPETPPGPLIIKNPNEPGISWSERQRRQAIFSAYMRRTLGGA